MQLTCIFDLLFPRTSLSGEEGEWITPEELLTLRSTPAILETPQLRVQGLDFIDRIVAAANYDDVSLLKKAVHTFKYRKVRGTGEILGRLLVEVSVHLDEGELCPVPLHWIRTFSRGFNQAELLAKIVGEERQWKVKSLLRRTRWTGSQMKRKRAERFPGVHDAFKMKPGLEISPHVILVDDLSTTGATLNMCAKALKKAGVKSVEGLVLAMG